MGVAIGDDGDSVNGYMEVEEEIKSRNMYFTNGS